MKKIALLLVLALGVFVLSACSGVASAYVQLDPALADWITIGATVVVGFLLAKAGEISFVKQILEYFHIEQHKLAISAWFAGVVIQFLQAGVLDRIPQMWDSVVTIVMQLIVAVIVTLYSFRLLADRKVEGFK
jgi:hypothetical protein